MKDKYKIESFRNLNGNFFRNIGLIYLIYLKHLLRGKIILNIFINIKEFNLIKIHSKAKFFLNYLI